MPIDAIVDLRRRLDQLPPRSSSRRVLVQEIAQLYGISEDTVYRALREPNCVRSVRRVDCDVPRIIPKARLERYCEIIAAIKIRTSNRKGRHLSTVQAIRLLEEDGIDTADGHVTVPVGLLKATTVNRYLKKWGYDRDTLLRQPPAVRFQAEYSNSCWHFDLSPSDLKHVKAPAWIEPGRGHPLLMLYSVVDDRSGVAYQEYHGVYGEDVEAALRFMFAAMSPKSSPDLPFQGIPQMLYMDNGPIARSLVFQKVMEYLGVEVRTHLPNGKDGRRVTARAKGKVERPFRTVKEMHETLYHLHEPETEAEANAWLMRFLLHYNSQPHRSEPHSRSEDWIANLPKVGIRQMCSWERFCTFARSPERRKVGIDARVTVEGVAYEVEPDLAGETVVLWWGLFDNELYVEHQERRYGPFLPVDGPIPLHRYRSFKKTRTQKRADRIEALAKQLSLPPNAIGKVNLADEQQSLLELKVQPFVDPDPFQELTYPTVIAAKQAIAEYLARPLAKLTPGQIAYINATLDSTLNKQVVMEKIRDFFNPLRGKA
ncbi:IS481 family transposase [Chroococcidiopsis cubana CCALA 043]|uniref:IS481 family transposase n=1 Tax=Chroococcidiopsis cubana TaxID=171392 RepID=UPI000D049C32|nr:IS481 family transposase [Chroococcidiopsis cubana]PSB55467.1 IS481 family transposase [Chroococcidiopsis cubana CCALA 043]